MIRLESRNSMSVVSVRVNTGMKEKILRKKKEFAFWFAAGCIVPFWWYREMKCQNAMPCPSLECCRVKKKSFVKIIIQ
jgi:hypothetical protein